MITAAGGNKKLDDLPADSVSEIKSEIQSELFDSNIAYEEYLDYSIFGTGSVCHQRVRIRSGHRWQSALLKIRPNPQNMIDTERYIFNANQIG